MTSPGSEKNMTFLRFPFLLLSGYAYIQNEHLPRSNHKQVVRLPIFIFLEVILLNMFIYIVKFLVVGNHVPFVYMI